VVRLRLIVLLIRYIAYFASIRTLKIKKSGVEACVEIAYAKSVYLMVG